MCTRTLASSTTTSAQTVDNRSSLPTSFPSYTSSWSRRSNVRGPIRTGCPSRSSRRWDSQRVNAPKRHRTSWINGVDPPGGSQGWTGMTERLRPFPCIGRPGADPSNRLLEVTGHIWRVPQLEHQLRWSALSIGKSPEGRQLLEAVTWSSAGGIRGLNSGQATEAPFLLPPSTCRRLCGGAVHRGRDRHVRSSACRGRRLPCPHSPQYEGRASQSTGAARLHRGGCGTRLAFPTWRSAGPLPWG